MQRELSVEVDRHHEACALVDCGGSSLHVDVEIGSRYVDRHRPGAGLRDSLERRRERQSRYDNLVAGFDAGGEQADSQCVEPARDPDALVDAAVVGPGQLECAHLRPVRERVRVDQEGELGEELVLEGLMRRAEIEERDGKSRRYLRHGPDLMLRVSLRLSSFV
jgi:hypothetical protein